MTAFPWIQRVHATREQAAESCRELAHAIGEPCSVWLVQGAQSHGVTVPTRYVVRRGWGMDAIPCTGAVQCHREEP